jgi:arginine decarboxylase
MGTDRNQVEQDVYNTAFWSDGYFQVKDGRLSVVAPSGTTQFTTLVKALEEKGVHFPVLVRFEHILKDRVARLCAAFQKAKVKE